MNPFKNLLAVANAWSSELGFEKDWGAYRIYSYEWIDRLSDFQDAKSALKDWPLQEAFIIHFKKRFSEAGWAGDGKMQLLWLPPFTGRNSPTTGFYVLHVKQMEDGISWIASRVPIVGLESPEEEPIQSSQPTPWS